MSEHEPKAIRVAIVDDHESVLLGLKSACLEQGYLVVATGATVSELQLAIAEQPVDVIVLDLSLGDGSQVTDNVVKATGMATAVLIHSIADRAASIREALAAGAVGVIPKTASASTVMDAIALVARGETLNNLEWASAIAADQDFARAQLTPREQDVLHLYASGLPLREVAIQLDIAFSSAREYLDRIRARYVAVGRPAPTKVELLRRAVEDGILAIDDVKKLGV